MDALGNGASFWWKLSSGIRKSRRSRRRKSSSSSSSSSASSDSVDVSRPLSGFPFKQAAVAASLTLTGDTIAQLRGRFLARRRRCEPHSEDEGIMSTLMFDHDWLRALRMASYGFLLYGPGSYAWYKFLGNHISQSTCLNLSMKVVLNQIVLGPCVIAVIFAWNNLWLGRLAELPDKYKNDALPTLLYGFRFWIPVSIINFKMIPLSAQVAFMSTCSIFWNFYLSTTMSK